MKKHKELKEEYKQMKFPAGVYCIRNTVNGRIFIGSSVNLRAIWNRNKLQLNFGNHSNAGLQNEWKEFGEDKFKFEILSEIKQKDDENTNISREVKELEKMYIDEIKPFNEKATICR